MDPFECPTCQAKTWKLIAPNRDSKQSDNGKLSCPTCYDKPLSSRPSYLHEYMPGTDGKITRAKWDIIGNRVKSKDDNYTVIDARTNRETQY